MPHPCLGEALNTTIFIEIALVSEILRTNMRTNTWVLSAGNSFYKDMKYKSSPT